MSDAKNRLAFDIRTATLDDIGVLFGISPLEAHVMQSMERGEYKGDVQAVDCNGNSVEEPAPAQTPFLNKADYIK